MNHCHVVPRKNRRTIWDIGIDNICFFSQDLIDVIPRYTQKPGYGKSAKLETYEETMSRLSRNRPSELKVCNFTISKLKVIMKFELEGTFIIELCSLPDVIVHVAL